MEEDNRLEFSKRMIGKKVFVVSLESYGLVEGVEDAYTFIVKVGPETRKVDIFDIRSGE